eukprot:Sspe_Gene.48358::Locus_25112_Transcript_1_1_Confidence_1.000_Length_1793::g.48358::m.48358
MGNCSSQPTSHQHSAARPRVPFGEKAEKKGQRDVLSLEGEELLLALWQSVVGRDARVQGPWGERQMTYADYTASGRALSFVEDFIEERVLAFYANTHTEASLTGLQTNSYRETARAAIKRSCKAGEDTHLVFTGSGATSAIHTLIGMLGLGEHKGEGKGPLFLYGPYEHHSNILPWREADATAIEIPPREETGLVDTEALEELLKEHTGYSPVIVSVSAASNVTGIVTDVRRVAEVAHRHGAFACFDYACGAPYLDIDMTVCDAVFISMHKFVGGPGTPGVLLVRHRMLPPDTLPHKVGGGTVDFVSETGQRYSTSVEAREEGGTPEIVGSIRAGLCFSIKDRVGTQLIHQKEVEWFALAKAEWAGSGIHILGNTDVDRVAVLSFLVPHAPTGRFLHHNFVVALLNDLFGIQTRGGCMCAGPYGTRLLDLTLQTVEKYTQLPNAELNKVKPGWTRLNLNYFMPRHEVLYILRAVRVVAEKGWRVMCEYEYRPNGAWVHRRSPPKVADLEADFRTFASQKATRTHSTPQEQSLSTHEALLADYLRTGERTLDAANPYQPWSLGFALDEPLRWFALPSDFTR